MEEIFGSYLTFKEDGYSRPSGPACDLVFQQVTDLCRILGFNEIQSICVKGSEPVDLCNRLKNVNRLSDLNILAVHMSDLPLSDTAIIVPIYAVAVPSQLCFSLLLAEIVSYWMNGLTGTIRVHRSYWFCLLHMYAMYWKQYRVRYQKLTRADK